ncbi:MAG: hypothetical protein H8K03_20330 [Nitrospira sp.]|jgi:hypothetical protein
MIARTHYSSDQIIAERGEQIYAERFQAEYEQHYSGQYVVIDILTKSAYVAAFQEEAINKAKAIAPNGLFHLVRIHTPTLFERCI